MAKLAGIITIVGVAFIGLIFVSYWTNSSDRSPPAPQNRTEKARIAIGDSCVIDSGQGLTAVARHPADFEDWYKAIRARDDYGLKELIYSGRILAVKDQSTILIIDSTATLYKIRVLDGDKQGKAGWIPIEHARKYPRQ